MSNACLFYGFLGTHEGSEELVDQGLRALISAMGGANQRICNLDRPKESQIWDPRRVFARSRVKESLQIEALELGFRTWRG